MKHRAIASLLHHLFLALLSRCLYAYYTFSIRFSALPHSMQKEKKKKGHFLNGDLKILNDPHALRNISMLKPRSIIYKNDLQTVLIFSLGGSCFQKLVLACKIMLLLFCRKGISEVYRDHPAKNNLRF